MKILNYSDIFKSDFEYLLNSYGIIVNEDYRFFYDEFFEHILEDTNKLVDDNFRQKINSQILEYKKSIFRGTFYKHFKYNDWFYKLKNPDTFPELKQKVRKNKLEKILK